MASADAQCVCHGRRYFGHCTRLFCHGRTYWRPVTERVGGGGVALWRVQGSFAQTQDIFADVHGSLQIYRALCGYSGLFCANTGLFVIGVSVCNCGCSCLERGERKKE